MDPNVRWVGVSASVRAFGISLIGPFFALYLYNILHYGYATVGLLSLLIGGASLLISPVGGLLADRIGRRSVFLSAIGGEAACLAATGVSMELHLAVFSLLGFAAAGIVATLGGPALSAYVADFTIGSERTQGFTWFRVGHNFGFTLGVLAGGSLVGLVGFAAVAFGGAIFSASGATLGAVFLRASPYDEGLQRGAEALVDSPTEHRRSGSFRASLRLLAHDRTFLIVSIAFALASVVAGQWAVTFPLFVVGRLGLPYAVLGAGLALNGLIVVFGQTAMTNRVLGHRHTEVAVLGTIAYAVGFLVLASAGQFDLDVWAAFFGATLILTLGENLLWIPQSTLPSNLAPPGEVGSYNGAFGTITGAGMLIAIGIGGLALSLSTQPLVVWSFLVAPIVPAMILLRVAGRRIRRDADRA